MQKLKFFERSSLKIVILMFAAQMKPSDSLSCNWTFDSSDNLSCNGVSQLRDLPLSLTSTVTTLSLTLDSSFAFHSSDFEPFDHLLRLEINSFSSDEKVEWLFETDCFDKLNTLKELKLVNGHLKFRSDLRKTTLQKLDIENCVLTDEPWRFEPGFETISIRNSELKRFESTFGDVSHLRKLVLCQNRIKNLSKNIFRNTFRLESVDVSYNQLSDFTDLFSNDLAELKHVNLEQNFIQSLTNETFRRLLGLIKLNLGHNEIDDVFEGVFRNQNHLKWLFLHGNRLKLLRNDVFLGLNHLEWLDLSNNRISNIESRTFSSLSNLRWLYLRNNRLLLIPQLNAASNLEQFDMNDNLLTVVDEAAFVGAVRLRRLSMSRNEIVALKDFAFRNLTSLVSLNLADNRISRIGNGSFEDLRSLTTLRLEQNHIDFDENIYEDRDDDDGGVKRNLIVFRNLDSVVLLNLSRNNLKEFRSVWCPNRLKTLDLSYNNVSSFDSTSSSLALEILDLSFNRLTIVLKNLLPSSVVSVYLNDNQIIEIDPDSLQLMTELRFLSLRNNSLESLILNRPSVRRVVELDVDSNRFICNCRLVWLQQVLVGKGSPFYVRDVNRLHCQNRFNKTREKTLAIFSVTDPQDLMCTFDEDKTPGIQLCLLWKIDAEDSSQDVTVCNPPCPKGCTCFRSEDWTKIHTQCTNVGLTSVPSASELHPITTSLFLDYNNFSRLKDDAFPHFRFLFELNLTSCGIEHIEEETFSSLSSLLRLYLKSNLLKELSSRVFTNLTELVELDLSYNLFTYLSSDLFEPLIGLLELYVNNNRLVRFPVWTFSSTKIYDLALYDNPWSCDCNYTALFRRWMQNATHLLRNNDRIYCLTDDEPPLKVSLIAYNESNCYETHRLTQLNDAQVTVLAVSLCTLTTVVVFAVLVFVYRREMQVLIYSRYGVRLFHRNGDEDNDNSIYDAFVSYSNLDEGFIVDDLLPGLEGIADPYHLCLHHRDFVVGEFITENIMNAIQQSRRTILVFSANFVQSEWCRYEFKMAHCRMLEDRCRRVIVILLGEVPQELAPEMKLYLRTNTYLTWGDRLFWEKLYFALPEKRALDDIALLQN